MDSPTKAVRTIRMKDEFEITKFQLISHCFVADIKLNDTELNILSLLCITGEMRLMEFCKKAVESGFLGNETAVNNCVSKIEKTKLLLKRGSGKKVIYLNPEVQVFGKGTVIVEYRLIKVDV